MILKSLFENFINTIFPSNCLICNNFLIKGEEIICLECNNEITIPNYNINLNQSYVSKLFYGKIPIKYCFTFLKFGKKSKIRYLIHNLKYKDKTKIGKILGQIYGSFILQMGFKNEFDYIIPIPLSKERIKIRGYNQSDFFGEGISTVLSRPLKKDFIIRKINTKSQTKISNEWDRWENMKNAFEIKEFKHLKNKSILLVDDVITTGSTIEACTHEFLKYGVSNISIATIAYA
ncbi:MAG: ComF family protein [Bacteroidetes bacterium]|nr:ComF family protein [Bacteroidota bacterium]